jgi:hypothetical protein
MNPFDYLDDELDDMDEEAADEIRYQQEVYSNQLLTPLSGFNSLLRLERLFDRVMPPKRT